MIIPISIWPGSMMNCFLITSEQGHILIDTGVPSSSKKILSTIEQAGFSPSDIKLIVVTHCHMDHFGGVGELKKLLQVPVLGHELDTPYFQKGTANTATMKPTVGWAHLFKKMVKGVRAPRFTPDIIMSGEAYDLSEYIDGVRLLHTPGHTPGSISVVLPNREAIIMDMMAAGIGLGGIMFHSRVKHPAFHDDLNALKSSFDKVLARELDRFYLGHGRSVNRQQVLKYVNKYLQ